ncbi:MAG: transglutaminase-like domain-containing protein [Candidatus Woesearchaeota archaeon]|nr:transglutaminase-like domain-containing protein [Candidatus Woesearchaeota archaeon]
MGLRLKSIGTLLSGIAIGAGMGYLCHDSLVLPRIETLSYPPAKEAVAHLTPSIDALLFFDKSEDDGSPLIMRSYQDDHELQDSLFSISNRYFPFFDALNQPLRIEISSDRYLKLKALDINRSPGSSNYAFFVTPEDPAVRQIATFIYFTENVAKNSFKPEEFAFPVVNFVRKNIEYNQKIEYKEDYVRFPVETLVEGNGDCEDMVILAASLLKSLGGDVAFMFYLGPAKEGQKPMMHVALGVNGDFSGEHVRLNGKPYYYAECTPSSLAIGVVPLSMKEWRRIGTYVIK